MRFPVAPFPWRYVLYALLVPACAAAIFLAALGGYLVGVHAGSGALL